jgi:hypothetical protein
MAVEPINWSHFKALNWLGRYRIMIGRICESEDNPIRVVQRTEHGSSIRAKTKSAKMKFRFKVSPEIQNFTLWNQHKFERLRCEPKEDCARKEPVARLFRLDRDREKGAR